MAHYDDSSIALFGKKLANATMEQPSARLCQMLESVQLDCILAQLDEVLQNQLKATEKRIELLEAARIVYQSACALVMLLLSTMDSHFSGKEVADLRKGLDALQRSFCTFGSQSDEHRDMDMQLGAKQSDLSKHLTQLKPVIRAIASDLGLESTVITSKFLKHQALLDASDSSTESESLPAEVTSYLQSIARAKTLQDQIADATGENGEMLQTTERTHGAQRTSSGNAISALSGGESSMSQMKQELSAAYQRSSQLRAICRDIDINVDEPRWRDGNQRKRRHDLKQNDAILFQGWLSEVAATEYANVGQRDTTTYEFAHETPEMENNC